jgi:hypothetical protein
MNDGMGGLGMAEDMKSFVVFQMGWQQGNGRVVLLTTAWAMTMA